MPNSMVPISRTNSKDCCRDISGEYAFLRVVVQRLPVDDVTRPKPRGGKRTVHFHIPKRAGYAIYITNAYSTT